MIHDILIVGSGIAGSAAALVLRKAGLSVCVVERDTHPRFAIGESSTPLADFKIARIADRFGLDWLRPFSKYGTWKATYPQMTCGLKRGFSFFRHDAGRRCAMAEDRSNALIVAASPDDATADMHWFRAEFDANLVNKAVADGDLTQAEEDAILACEDDPDNCDPSKLPHPKGGKGGRFEFHAGPGGPPPPGAPGPAATFRRG